MNIYKTTLIGTHHTNHCEDFLLTEEIGQSKLLIAVMDGCTMGIDSHFASTLMAKLLKKISKKLYYKEFITKEKKSLKTILKIVIDSLFQELKSIQNQLGLSRYELLSTLILGSIDTLSKNAEIIVIGDGLIFHNDTLTAYEQNNQPDYLVYHLHEDFNQWYNQQTQRLSLEDIYDLSISTDGIFTFQKFDNHLYEEIEEKEIIHFLLKDKQGYNSENMLRNKVETLAKNHGLKTTDDLGIIRIIF